MNTTGFGIAAVVSGLVAVAGCKPPAGADSAMRALEKGVACQDRGDYDSAISAYTEAIRLDTGLVQAYVGRGFAYCQNGDLERALADTTEAIRLDPNNA